MTSTLAIGSIIHQRYCLQELTQKSQFTEIYQAQDQIRNNQICILRSLIEKKLNDAARVAEQFQAELTLLTEVNHPQIQSIKDFFWENDRLYIIQDYYVVGQIEQNWLQNRPALSETEAIQLLIQILPVLSYLHERHISHRNISPSNLIFRSSDHQPILTNFGIIQEIMDQMEIETNETKLLHEVRKLPVGFIPTGVEEDLYALAVTIIILLTGKEVQVLFDSTTKTWDWERWKLLSDQLTQVVNRMLAVQVSDRFPSANAVLAALNSPAKIPVPSLPTVLSPPPIANPYLSPQAAPPTGWIPTNVSSAPLAKPVQNNTWLLAFAGGILLTLIGIIAIIYVKGWSGFNSADQKAPSAIASPTILPTPTPPALTEPEAVNLINQYLQAKKQMFAPPYDRQIAANIMTGKAYHDVTGPEGTITWLQQHNSYYRYGNLNAGSTGYFNTSGDQAEIQVIISEEVYFYVNNILNKSDNYSANYRFSLRRENNTWKIADRQNLNK